MSNYRTEKRLIEIGSAAIPYADIDHYQEKYMSFEEVGGSKVDRLIG